MRLTSILALTALAPGWVLCAADTRPAELVLCHTFDEGRGLIARDVSGGRGHAVLGGDAKWTDGRHGSAVQLTGVSSAGVELGLPASWYVEHQQAMTVLLGVKPSAASGQIIFGVHSSAKGRLYVAVGQGGRWAMGLGERPWGKDEKRAGGQADAEWHALAMTLDHGAATLYVDGAKYSEKPYTDIGITLAPRLGGAGQFGFDGAVDEIAIFRGVLSEGEVRSAAAGLAESGLLAKYARPAAVDDRRGLVAEWRFDDGPGAVAADSSGNGLHGAATACEPTAGIEGLGLLLPARGASCWVEVPHSEKLGSTDALTVSAWLHWDPRSSNYAALIDKGYTDGLAIYFTRYSQRVHVALATDQAKVNVSTGVRAPVYEWMHLALTWSGTTGRVVLYLDGKRAWDRALAGARLAPCKASLLIGKGRRPAMGTLGRCLLTRSPRSMRRCRSSRRASLCRVGCRLPRPWPPWSAPRSTLRAERCRIPRSQSRRPAASSPPCPQRTSRASRPRSTACPSRAARWPCPRACGRSASPSCCARTYRSSARARAR